MRGVVGHMLPCLDKDSSAGLAGIAPLLPKAGWYDTVVNLESRQIDKFEVLLPILAAVFRPLLVKGIVLSAWKRTKLTPLHKKGSLTDPGKL